MLAVEEIKKSYKDRQALAGVSLGAAAGECVAILGPNGAGKSTLFAILAGLRDADSGRILYKEKEVSADDPALRLALGVVFQSPSLDGLLSAQENLVLGAGLFGMSKAQAKPRAAELLQLMELSERAKDRVDTFSGGMKRRLELARALMHGPKVLLLDEPTSGLDEGGYRQVWKHLDDLRQREGLTILLVTHRSDEAERCDRALVLDEGKLIAEGTPAELRAQLEGDLLELEGPELASFAAQIESIAGVKTEPTENGLRLRLANGHSMLPKLIDALPDGMVKSVHLRQPTLGDVFVSLTGRSLEAP